MRTTAAAIRVIMPLYQIMPAPTLRYTLLGVDTDMDIFSDAPLIVGCAD
ncbi:MAG: hypothetical protein JXQ72_04930 [Anaerolineae bacterium]|nr:hypothetical protein [Anaerolineae bacterium]